MFYVETSAKAKRSARALEKFLKSSGLNLQHGQALDAISRIAGFEDWNGLSASFSETAVDSRINPGEKIHLEDAGDPQYEDEIAILAHSGFYLKCPAFPQDCDYVRITDPLGREIGYWVSDEWRESPAEVMGAILGALVRGDAVAQPSKRMVAPKKVFKIQDVPFARLSGAIIEGLVFNDALCSEENLHLLSEDETQDQDEIVATFTCADDGSVEYRDVSAAELKQLRWDVEQLTFLDKDNNPWKFFTASDVTNEALGFTAVGDRLRNAAPDLRDAILSVLAQQDDTSAIDFDQLRAVLAKAQG
jgi:hypothetical protein